MAIASSSTITHMLHRVLHRPPFTPQRPKLLSSFFTAPLFTPMITTASSAEASIFSKAQLQHTIRSTSLFTPSSSLSSTPSLSPPDSLAFEQEHYSYDGGNSGSEEMELEEIGGDTVDSERDEMKLEESHGGNGEVGLKRNSVKVPTLTVKEKKELASYAHGLGKKLKCQLVGKSGVTGSVVSSFIETLEANELLKIKIHRTCPGELEDVVQHLEEATGSVVVGQIGRTIIVYRPSLSKLKAEEKKRQDRRIYMRRVPKLTAMSLPRGQVPSISRRGRRGSSRMHTKS